MVISDFEMVLEDIVVTCFQCGSSFFINTKFSVEVNEV